MAKLRGWHLLSVLAIGLTLGLAGAWPVARSVAQGMSADLDVFYREANGQPDWSVKDRGGNDARCQRTRRNGAVSWRLKAPGNQDITRFRICFDKNGSPFGGDGPVCHESGGQPMLVTIQIPEQPSPPNPGVPTGCPAGQGQSVFAYSVEANCPGGAYGGCNRKWDPAIIIDD